MAETAITSPGQATRELLVAAARDESGLRGCFSYRRFMLAKPEPARPTEEDLSDIEAARAALSSPEPREPYDAVQRELRLDEE